VWFDLDPAYRHKRVAAGVQGLSGEILKLADFVATEGDSRVAVLAFGPGVDLAAKRLGQTGEGMHRRWPKEKWFSAKVVEAHRAALRSLLIETHRTDGAQGSGFRAFPRRTRSCVTSASMSKRSSCLGITVGD
jgi:hypothetical protein